MLEQARLNRTPIPDRILNKPILAVGLQFYLTAFVELSSCRPVGMAEGRIPWTAVREYALHCGLDEIEFDILWELITRVDAAYLEWQSKRADKKGAIAKPPPKKAEGVVNIGRK